jgi:hypothetical protein
MKRTLQVIAIGAIMTVFPLTALAQETFYSFVSDPGDFVGNGQSGSFSPETSSFASSQSNDGNHFAAFLFPFAGGFWMLDFAAPAGQPLAPGVYENATRWPFQAASVPGLAVFGNGVGCNTLNGRFEVLEASFGPAGYVERFHATFEQHCEGIEPALRGEIKIVNPPPPPVLSISLVPDVRGTVDRSGTATIRGVVTCSTPTTISLGGQVRQTVTRFALASGNLQAQVPCSPTPTAWSATVVPAGSVPFGPGYASVTLTAIGFDPNYPGAVVQEASSAVKLSRSTR